MTVRVLSVQKRRITCNHCSALLEFERADVKRVSFHVMGESDSQEQIICPQCKRAVVVIWDRCPISSTIETLHLLTNHEQP